MSEIRAEGLTWAEKREAFGALAAALAKAQATFAPIVKRRTAKIESSKGNYQYRYADLADILTAVTPALADNGLALAQEFEGNAADMLLVTRLLHEGGAGLSSRLSMQPFLPSAREITRSDGSVVTYEPRPQEQGSTITYARRYAICALLCVAGEEDDDGAAAQAAPKRAKQSGAGSGGPSPAKDAPAVRNSSPAPDVPAFPPGGDAATAHVPPLCPECGGEMYDNRDRRAEDEKAKKPTPRPAWKCKKATWDPKTKTAGGCAGVVWPADPLQDANYCKVHGIAPPDASPPDDEAPPAAAEDAPHDAREELLASVKTRLHELGCKTQGEATKMLSALAKWEGGAKALSGASVQELQVVLTRMDAQSLDAPVDERPGLLVDIDEAMIVLGASLDSAAANAAWSAACKAAGLHPDTRLADAEAAPTAALKALLAALKAGMA